MIYIITSILSVHCYQSEGTVTLPMLFKLNFKQSRKKLSVANYDKFGGIEYSDLELILN